MTLTIHPAAIGPAAEAIAARMNDGRERTITDIALSTGINAAWVKRTLNKMMRAGLIQSDRVCAKGAADLIYKKPDTVQHCTLSKAKPIRCNEDDWIKHMPLAGQPGRYNQRERSKIIQRATDPAVEDQRAKTLKGIREHGPISAVPLAVRLGLQRGRVQRALHHLHDTGKINRIGDCNRTKWESMT